MFGGPPPENFRIFDLPRLDFLKFQHFRSFLDKKALLLGGAKTLQWGGGATQGLGGALAPPVYMLKEALVICVSNKLQYLVDYDRKEKP